ncbi:MAG: hypothetical protein ABSF67_16185 [Roseiarcus sp.]
MAYFLEFFQTDRDGRRAKVHEEIHNAPSIEHARRFAASMMKFTTFSGFTADLGVIRDQDGSFSCELILNAARP